MAKKVKAKKKFWAFRALDSKEAELTIYGEIADSQGGWFSDGQEITPTSFKAELDALGYIKTLLGGTCLRAVTFCRSASGPGICAKRQVSPSIQIVQNSKPVFAAFVFSYLQVYDFLLAEQCDRWRKINKRLKNSFDILIFFLCNINLQQLY